MKQLPSVQQISLLGISLALLTSAAADPIPASSSPFPGAAPAGSEALTPKSITSGSVLKIKGCFTTNGTWNYVKDETSQRDIYTSNEVISETFMFETSSSYGDPDGDKFSITYKRIDNFTAEASFVQTKAGGGDTLQNEKGTGKFTLLFTSFDKATKTLNGTIVWADSYQGNGWYDAEAVMGKYVDKTNGTGIFSLKLK